MLDDARRPPMNMVLTDDDLEPFSASGFAWRWKDPKHSVLPDNALESVRALRRPVARLQFQPSLEMDRWVRDNPGREIDTDANPEGAVAAWLSLAGFGSDLVIASWSEDEAVYLPLLTFATYWSAFCYPSSDDVTVWPLTRLWAISYAHSGQFFWRARVEHRVV